ncbi:MAG: UDP-N-acetylmuramoyl-L-alanine--D-glutamate ligase [Acidobacteriota bacterium]|nr:UDP-N-acetylmuramoyl-L-alanine--D-glutamate ligase [Acidobacteriota bacterium]
MFRPTGFADLRGRRVGVFGFGVEGRATVARLRDVADLVVVDDRDGLGAPVLVTSQGGFDALATCDVVLKSPGIARRRADVLELEARGVTVTSALNLWLADAPRDRVVAVTGTKGKSTTTTLIEFAFRSLGQRARALGNLGQPPYDPAVEIGDEWLVLEVSSFQSVDVTHAPAFVVVTSLGEDHLDWHGSLEQYHDDKLTLTRADGAHVTFVADGPTPRANHARIGGEIRWIDDAEPALARDLGLLGAHNARNVALALHVVAVATSRPRDVVRDAMRTNATNYVSLAGRLTLIHVLHTPEGAVRFVDDGLATAPLPTLAALDVFDDEPLALIAGGFDRGVDYAPLANALRARPSETHVVTMGPAGERLGALVAARHATTMDEAVTLARGALPRGGVVLFSPAAPSFDRYANWEERSRDFARAARDAG